MSQKRPPTTRRGRLEVTGFDPVRVEDRPSLSASDDRDAQREAVAGAPRWRRAAHRFRRNRSAMAGLVVVGAMVALTVFARPITLFGVAIQPFALAPHDPNTVLYLQEGYTHVSPYDPPSAAHPMGIDDNGRDLFSRVLYGGRYSLSIAFIVVAITASVGVVYGAIAGYYGGWVDELLMRVVDTIYAFPMLVLAMAIVAMVGGGFWQIVVAFSLVGWVGYARLIRGEILSITEREYVLAARAVGASDRRIIASHVVPNAIAPVVVQASLSVGIVVIGVAALGFLGIGMEPGTPEWGTMLDATLGTIVQGPGGQIPWWATVFPGAAIAIFVFAMNLVGDGITDALNVERGDSPPHGGGG